MNYRHISNEKLLRFINASLAQSASWLAYSRSVESGWRGLYVDRDKFRRNHSLLKKGEYSRVRELKSSLWRELDRRTSPGGNSSPQFSK